jgi:integrase
MQVTAILKGKTDKNGHIPIKIRVYHEGKRNFTTTGYKIHPDLFKNGRVDKKHPQAQEWNRKIETMIIQAQAKALKEPEKKKPKTYLFPYITSCMRKWDGVKKTGTIRIYLSQLEKLKSFTADIQLSQIDNNFLYAYHSHLINLRNSKNTVWSSFKFLRTILNEAVKDDLLDKSPFKKFPMPKYQETAKEYLLPEEIKKIEKFVNNKNCPPELVFAGTWFLIACDTGLRLSDLRSFDKKKNIHAGRLVVKTVKTGEPIGMPISDHLKKLFEKVEYKPMHYTGEQYNRLLKLVVMGAGIDKKVSSHTGRYTAAMSFANSGISQEVTAKILGHADLRSTRTYYKISNQRIDMELKKRKR